MQVLSRFLMTEKIFSLADMILVDGNPLEDIDLVAGPDKNFVLIMKDGAIYKKALN